MKNARLPVFAFFVLFGFAVAQSTVCFAQGSGDEIATLKVTIADLESRLAAVEAERNALRQRVADLEKKLPKDEGDQFQVGTIWTGTRFLGIGKGTRGGDGQPWRLVISERDGEKFKGQIRFISERDKKPQELEVSGSATTNETGKVAIRTLTTGPLEQSFEGVLKSDQISLTWQGFGVGGRKISGTSYLSRK